MDDFKKPFRVTVENYDEKITIEKDHSDITFNDYMEMLKAITGAVFSLEFWEEYFKE